MDTKLQDKFTEKNKTVKKWVDSSLIWIYNRLRISENGIEVINVSHYPVLTRAIEWRGIKKKTIAACINMNPVTLRDRLSGRGDFSWHEAMAIHERFFPDIPLEELFRRADDDIPEIGEKRKEGG